VSKSMKKKEEGEGEVEEGGGGEEETANWTFFVPTDSVGKFTI
jgi:hypothetical protein